MKTRDFKVRSLLSLVACLIGVAAPASSAENVCNWSPANCHYGDGSDGDDTVPPSVTLILTGDRNFRNLTVSAGGTLVVQGHALRICGTLLNEGTIKDTASGGEGGVGGDGGRGANPYWEGPDSCQEGECGSPGAPPVLPQAGRGGGGGGGGSGGGGAWYGTVSNITADADGGWCDNCGGASQNDKGRGGNGGDGGGYVRIWAYRINNTGVIHADGEDGEDGGEGGDGEYYDGLVVKDLAGGGGGGGAGGDGGEGGTVEIRYVAPLALGSYTANGGDGGTGGYGGLGGTQAVGHCLQHGVIIGGHDGDGCPGACCEDCIPRPCWTDCDLNPCGGDGGPGEHRAGYCSGDGDRGDDGCCGPDGQANAEYFRPGDFDNDGDVDPVDREAFIGCFTGSDGGPVTKECLPGDMDCDNDVDCTDWALFKEVWTEGGMPEDIPQCTAGACVFPGGACHEIVADECSDQGGHFEGAGSLCSDCQYFDIWDGNTIECDGQAGRGCRCADDFRALTTGELTRVSWWPAFVATPGNPSCSDPGLTPPGYWHLRVYEDFGGIPDEASELGPPGGQDLIPDVSQPVGGDVWKYGAPVGGAGIEPIPLNADECYWIEISGAGEPECAIHWATSDQGNTHAMQDCDTPGDPHYTVEDRIETDLAFCVSNGLSLCLKTYAPLPATYPNNRQRNRYLAFDPNAECHEGLDVMFKVTLTSLNLKSCDGSGSPNVEGWPCRTDADCRACSTNENPCWTAGLHCEAGETCDLTGAVCLNDHTVDPANDHHSVARSWWVGPQDPTTGVHLLVTELYRMARPAGEWPNPIIVSDCEVAPAAIYDVRTVDADDDTKESEPLEVKTTEKPDKFWGDCVAPLDYHCAGNWRPCDTSADCGLCYDWLLGPTDPNNGSSLIPCTSDADCMFRCSLSGTPCTPCPDAEVDCPPGETCDFTGEYCGTDCILQWPPPDGFINFQDINAAVFTFSGLPTVTSTDIPNIDVHPCDPPDYLVNFNDISLLVQTFAGWPYPCPDPGDCPLEMGACCSPGQTCAVAACTHCEAAGGHFAGAGTTCADNNENGVADACEAYPPLPSSYPDNVRKNLYITFDPNKTANNGANVAFKVTLISVLSRSCDDTGTPDIEGWRCGTDDHCGACSGSGNPCWTAALQCAGGETCDLTGAQCVDDQAGSVGMSWWVGPQHPTYPVHPMVTEPYRAVSDDWPAVVRVGDCEIVPVATYGVRAVNVDTGAESAELEVATIDQPSNADWADISGSQGAYCEGNWRPCSGDGDCGFCYDWNLGPGDPDNGSTLRPCASDEDCLVDGVFIGEYCGTVCNPSLWPPPDGILDMHDSNAMTSLSQRDRTDLDGNYLVNFLDINLMMQAMQGWPYLGGPPGDCPDEPDWP